MVDFKDMIKDLGEAQEVEQDNRKKVREADHFVNKRDGQWEPEIIRQLSGKPRYTFDECSPIIDDIMGEIASMDFDIRVTPAGGGATKDVANLMEGIIRNIENMSKAHFMYNAAARIMVGTGFAAWRVVTDFRDSDSFQQDLLIKSIPNAQDSVWFDPNAVEQDMSDAGYGYVLTSLTKADYKKKWPKGSGKSVAIDLDNEVYSYKKPHEVIIGEYLYRKESLRELALLSDGRVVLLGDDFDLVKDELEMEGVTVEKTRTRKAWTVFQRIFDGEDYLSSEAETVFEYLPIVPVYGNFKISERKVLYHGIVEKLMDPQRVLNYAESRKIEEGALAPRGKYWATTEQVKSPAVKQTIRTLNTNADPVQIYDHDPESPGPPVYQGAPQSNPGLVEVAASAKDFIQRTSGTFDEARGTAPAQRSGFAIDKLQQKSDNPKRKWVTPMEIGLSHTCTILVKAIPKVYDTHQKLRLVNQDDTVDEAEVYQAVKDRQTGKEVIVNDLTKGAYSVVCSAGPAFRSQQQETVAVINEIAALDPTIMEIGADVLLNNISSPGVKDIAERKRKQMLAAGLIPESQMNEDELEEAQAAKDQPTQPDAMMVMAKAEQAKAQADMVKAQAAQQATALKAQIEQQKLQLESMKLQLQQQNNESKLQLEATKAIAAQIKAQADTLKAIREAIGADSILTPEGAAAYDAQAKNLARSFS